MRAGSRTVGRDGRFHFTGGCCAGAPERRRPVCGFQTKAFSPCSLFVLMLEFTLSNATHDCGSRSGRRRAHDVPKGRRRMTPKSGNRFSDQVMRQENRGAPESALPPPVAAGPAPRWGRRPVPAGQGGDAPLASPGRSPALQLSFRGSGKKGRRTRTSRFPGRKFVSRAV